MQGDENYWQEWMKRRMSRRTMLRRAGLTGLVLAGGSSLWACGNTEAPKAAQPSSSSPTTSAPATSAPAPTPTKVAGPTRGGTLKVGGNATLNFAVLDPHTYFANFDEPYLRAIFDYLANYDDKVAYTPAVSLAGSWDAVDDVTLQFKLRQGVKFSDGTEWNSKVLKFNFDRIANKETKSPRAYALDSVKSIDYPDNYTCKIVLKAPMASILGEFAHAGFGMVSPANVAKWDAKELQLHPVGTGAFTLAEHLTDDYNLLTRNKDYWQKDDKGDPLPYVDAVKFMVIPDSTVRLANLRTGVIDMDVHTALKDVASIKQDPNLDVIMQNGVQMAGVFWNLSRAPFNNLNFRRAIAYGINRDAMVKTITFGLSKVYNGIVLPAHAWAFDPSRKGFPYDPVKAKQYLDQAIAAGIKPEFTSNASPGEYLQASEMMQADLSKIGVKMNIKTEDVLTSANGFWTSFKIDCFYAGYTMGPDPYSKIYVAHHSKGLYTPEEEGTRPGWDTPEGYFAKLDPLLEASNKTYDPKQRAKLLYQASDVLDDNVGFLATYYSTLAIAHNKKVQGASGGGDGKGRFERTWLKA